MVRTDTAAAILVIPALVIALVRASGPGAPSFATECAFVALTGALGFLFLQLADEDSPGFRIQAALGAALFAAAPATIGAVTANPDPGLIASLTAMAVGLIVLRWRPEAQWHAWAALIPAAVCIPLHRVGIVFVILALADAWLWRAAAKSLLACWPALAISGAAVALHRSEPWALAGTPQAAVGALASFCWPFDSTAGAGWSAADGWIALLLLAAAGAASLIVLRLKAGAFGILWFLAAILVAPTAPLAAFAGLALALSGAVLALIGSGIRSAPSILVPLTAEGEANQDSA